MTRRQCVCVYSPVIVIVVWAVAIIVVGRSDWLSIGGLVAIAVSLFVHTKELTAFYERR